MKPTYEELEAENRSLREIIKKLKRRVADLKAQLNKNSKNSSKPPSSDQKPNLPPKKKKKRRPYHAGASRQLLPEIFVTSKKTRVIKNYPSATVQ